MLKKNSGFTAVAVLTLAVAIGANAVVFSVMNGLILRALKVPQAQSLYIIERASDKDSSQSYPNYLDLRDRNRSFDGLADYNIREVALDAGKNPSRAWVFEVSGNYFDALGIQPYLGRVIHASDEHGANSAPYIVLTYAYWHSHFQGDLSVVGRVLLLNEHPFTVIGVTPPSFRGTVLIFSADFFVPIINQDQSLLNARENRWMGEVIGHLKAGVAPAQGASRLYFVGSGLGKRESKKGGPMKFFFQHSWPP